MQSIRIYQNILLQENSVITLDTAATHHLINVLRIKENTPLIIFNGQGGEYSATIQTISRKFITVKIKNFIAIERESACKIHLLQSFVSRDKMDLIVQKACELGVYAITPVITQFCNIKSSEEIMQKKLTHWQTILINACEQCGRNKLPILHSPIDFMQVIKEAKEQEKFILHPYVAENIKFDDAHKQYSADIIFAKDGNNSFVNAENDLTSVAVLIGPEGGFTDKEIELAQENHFQTISLGLRILRAETAAIATISILQNRYGDYFFK